MIEQSVALDLPAVMRARVNRKNCDLAVLCLRSDVAFRDRVDLALGKDVHWDAVNYHLYLGYAALNDRFGVDFFAAGTPSYINPYAYVPLYLMDRAGVPALVIAIALASIHAAILWLTYELALVAGIAGEQSQPRAFAVLALVFAAFNPVLLLGLGSTMVDISTGSLSLPVGSGSAARFVVSRPWYRRRRGVVRGGSSTQAVECGLRHCGASDACLSPRHMARSPARGPVFGVACGASFVLVSLPWSWRLSQEFGNPLFPFLNTLFVSPDFTSAPLHYERFHPGTLQELLVRPFRMLSAHSMVHTESRAPDLRYAVLFLALAAWALAACARRQRGVGRMLCQPCMRTLRRVH